MEAEVGTAGTTHTLLLTSRLQNLVLATTRSLLPRLSIWMRLGDHHAAHSTLSPFLKVGQSL